MIHENILPYFMQLLSLFIVESIITSENSWKQGFIFGRRKSLLVSVYPCKIHGLFIILFWLYPFTPHVNPPCIMPFTPHINPPCIKAHGLLCERLLFRDEDVQGTSEQKILRTSNFFIFNNVFHQTFYFLRYLSSPLRTYCMGLRKKFPFLLYLRPHK